METKRRIWESATNASCFVWSQTRAQRTRRVQPSKMMVGYGGGNALCHCIWSVLVTVGSIGLVGRPGAGLFSAATPLYALPCGTRLLLYQFHLLTHLTVRCANKTGYYDFATILFLTNQIISPKSIDGYCCLISWSRCFIHPTADPATLCEKFEGEIFLFSSWFNKFVK